MLLKQTFAFRTISAAFAALLLVCASVASATQTQARALAYKQYSYLFNLGLDAAREKNYSAAERYFERAVNQSEESGIKEYSAYNALGWVLFSRRNFVKAEDNYLKGIGHEADNPDSLNRRLYSNIGALYYSMGNFEHARKYLHIADVRYDSAAARNILGKISAIQERQEKTARTEADIYVKAKISENETKEISEAAKSKATISVEAGNFIGSKVWFNETGGNEDNLINWNKGEKHASVGIGHFIWYPEGYEGPFTESFPPLVDYLVQQQVKLPDWLRANRNCPWSSRDELMSARDRQSKKYTELKRLLQNTKSHQVEFLTKRLTEALPKMMADVPDEESRAHILAQFQRVSRNSDGEIWPLGVYALLDYVNFKGEGTNARERYKGEGWGLLQVLENMPGDSDDPLQEFVNSAKEILQRRLDNAPPERNEDRWKAGWIKRVETYTEKVSFIRAGFRVG